jgi:hypothetical protein
MAKNQRLISEIRCRATETEEKVEKALTCAALAVIAWKQYASSYQILYCLYRSSVPERFYKQLNDLSFGLSGRRG